MSDQVLTREDPDAAAIVQAALRRDGVDLRLANSVVRVEKKGDERVVHVRASDGIESQVAVDEVLVAVGRSPNVDDLGLERVGVEVNRRGVVVDDFLRTTNPRIFAAGDVCMRWQFTHAADAAAKIVVQNALFFGRKKVSSLIMPWCTYTDPEIAHVGMYARDAEAAGIEIDTYQVPLERNNRAVSDGEDDGFVKVHTRKGKDTIVGATIVAAHAGDMISPLTLAITQGIGLGKFTDVIQPYPTQAEAIKAVAGAYTRTKLTPTVAKAFRFLMRLRR
jgi:pyruvate/2-oxoglutarate dehydrogenase complex dihydrolipoamide dehydrogenase (E3) component